jgi:hypothetical protein
LHGRSRRAEGDQACGIAGRFIRAPVEEVGRASPRSPAPFTAEGIGEFTAPVDSPQASLPYFCDGRRSCAMPGDGGHGESEAQGFDLTLRTLLPARAGLACGKRQTLLLSRVHDAEVQAPARVNVT